MRRGAKTDVLMHYGDSLQTSVACVHQSLALQGMAQEKVEKRAHFTVFHIFVPLDSLNQAEVCLPYDSLTFLFL